MDEFLKINWSVNDISQLEQNKFISENCIQDSFVFKGLKTNNFESNDKEIERDCEYIPGKVHYVQGNIPSQLSKQEQFQCIKALQILQANEKKSLDVVEQGYVSTYNNLRKKILEENQSFMNHVKKKWRKKLLIPKSGQKFIPDMWKKKMSSCLDYQQFYQDLLILPLSYSEEENSVEVNHLKNIYELGTLAKFSKPSLKNKCLLQIKFSDEDRNLELNSKLSVSQDKNIPSLSEKNDFDVAISSSALKKIMDSNWQNNWSIPVIIRRENGKKIVFVDKVLPHKNPTSRRLTEKLYKIVVKANLCQFKALSFENNQNVLNNNAVKVDSTSTGNSNINTDENNDKKLEDKSNIQVNYSMHNVSYRIWDLKRKQNYAFPNSDKNIRLLVRCKLDSCEQLENGTLQPVIVAPKLEYQLGYGAEEPTKTELSNLWTSLFFRPYSNSYRIHLNPINREVVVVEECSLQKLNYEALHFHKFKPCLGLHVLYKICQNLVQQEEGDYLLHHVPKQGAFATLMKSTDLSTPTKGEVYDLHKEYDPVCFKINPENTWRPLDPNFILPVHLVFKRMPGMFVPIAQKKIIKKKKGKRKKPK